MEQLTEKRFVIPNQMRVIKDTITGEEATFYDTEDGLLLKEWLNALAKENEQLKGEVAHYKLILMSLEQQAKRMSSIRRNKND